MPQASNYQPDDKNLRYAADEERKARALLHTTNRAYFTGNMKPPLKVEGKYNDNTLVPIARNAVQDIVNFTAPDFPKLQLDDNAETDIEAVARNYWDAMGKPLLLLHQMLYAGAIDGQVFVRLVPKVAQSATQQHSIRILPSEQMVVFWDEDDLQKVSWYEFQWQAGRAVYRQDTVAVRNMYGDITEWVIYDYKQAGNQWELTNETAWPYPLGPIVDWSHLPQLGSYYGRHEFENAGLNDQVNYLASLYTRILRYHAYPRTIGIGMDAQNIQETAVNGLWTVPNPDAKIITIEMMSDLTPIRNQIQWLEAHYNRAQQIVTLDSALGDYKNITNLGLNVAFMPMIHKAQILQENYGDGLADITKRFLMLDGMDYSMTITPEWGNALPVDRAALVDSTERQVALSVMSKRTAAAQLGLDYDVEQERMNAEGASTLLSLADPRAFDFGMVN